MNEDQLRQQLRDEFDPNQEHLNTVVQEAVRSERSGKFEKDFAKELTEELVIV